MSRLTDSALVPYLTPRTCTDPRCDGSCGERRAHPNAPVLVPADEETIGCG
jgi:hypothetical protein